MIKRLKKFIEQIKLDKKYEYLFLSIILILSFLLRVYKLQNPVADWHSWRQADTVSVSRIYANEGINILYPRYYDISTAQSGLSNPHGYRFVEFPIYNLIHVSFYKIFNSLSLEAWGRLVSVLFSLASVLFVYLIGRKYLGKWGGLLSGLFYAIIPYNVYYSRVILPEPAAVFFGLAALWCFIAFIEKERSVFLLVSSVLFSFALLTKPYIVFYSVPMIYLAIEKYGLKMFKNKPLVIFGLISVVPLLLWRYWIRQHPEGIPFWTWAFNEDGIRFKPSFWRWIFAERLGKLILGVWGLIPFIFGVLDFKKKKAFIYAFLFGVFLYVTVVATASVKHDYYQVLTIPAIALFLANGSLILWTQKLFNKWLARIVLLFSLGLGIYMGCYQVKEFYKINNPQIIAAGEAVDRLSSKSDLIIAPYNGDTAFLYQTGRYGWPVIDRPLPELIEKGAKYLVTVNLDDQRMIDLQSEYEIVEKTDKYVMIDLTKQK